MLFATTNNIWSKEHNIFKRYSINIFHKLCFFFCILKSRALQTKTEQVRGTKKECISYSLDFLLGAGSRQLKQCWM